MTKEFTEIKNTPTEEFYSQKVSKKIKRKASLRVIKDDAFFENWHCYKENGWYYKVCSCCTHHKFKTLDQLVFSLPSWWLSTV